MQQCLEEETNRLGTAEEEGQRKRAEITSLFLARSFPDAMHILVCLFCRRVEATEGGKATAETWTCSFALPRDKR